MASTSLKVELEFAGGAELLIKDKEKLHNVELPLDPSHTSWTLHLLMNWIKEHLLIERPELFIINNNVRPGILVLVNDVDWELLGQEKYVLKDKDRITYISTLHGG